MAKKAKLPASKRQELVTKAIFEALLRLDEVKNLDIRHNVNVNGRGTKHQIDVSLKFQAGGIDHFVIVQVKKKKRRAEQGDLIQFQGVLADVPGQPRGIFVSESGYQSGAQQFADAAGIDTYDIREMLLDHEPKKSRSPITR